MEVSRPLVDNNGYDLILECGSVVRHVQLKVKKTEGKTAHWKVHLALAKKPSGCVIVLEVDDDKTEIRRFLWFGGEPRKPLPDLSGCKTAKHSKGNAQGIKAERPNLKNVPIKDFSRCSEISEIAVKLFGKKFAGARKIDV